jgi:hypothetical protein
MKCIMRLLSLCGSDIAPLVSLILAKLTGVFARVAKNPVNPHYNHYLFECYALLIRACCLGQDAGAARAACDAFEGALFPPFQEVLAQDISEFTPYVFQLLSQLLAFRPGQGLSEPYRQLFPPLLSPLLWERRGNVPALAQLLCTYVQRDTAFVCGSLQVGVCMCVHLSAFLFLFLSHKLTFPPPPLPPPLSLSLSLSHTHSLSLTHTQTRGCWGCIRSWCLPASTSRMR